MVDGRQFKPVNCVRATSGNLGALAQQQLFENNLLCAEHGSYAVLPHGTNLLLLVPQYCNRIVLVETSGAVDHDKR